MIKMSKRLQAIAGYVPDRCKLADIGSDHALLPVYLAERGRVSFAVAGEITDGPLQAAAKQVRLAGVQDRVDVRKGDGLAVISPGEVEVITIAGMGGSLIVHILEQGTDKLSGVERLILQPNVAEDQVRRWLVEHDWLLEEEMLLEEDGKLYEILCAVRHPEAASANAELYRSRPICGDVAASSELLYRFGPYLCARPTPLFFRKWETELEKLDQILAGMDKAETNASKQRAAVLSEQRNRMREVLQCMQTDKRSFN